MKVSEFRKLIREEVYKVINEASPVRVKASKLGINYSERTPLIGALKKKYKLTLMKKLKGQDPSLPIQIFKIENTPYVVVDEAGFGAVYNENDYDALVNHLSK